MKIPQVKIRQKAQGGTFYVQFRDSRENSRQRKTSTETKEYEVAKRIAQELSTLLRNQTLWREPPDTYHPRTLAIWGVTPISTQAVRAKQMLPERTHRDQPIIKLGDREYLLLDDPAMMTAIAKAVDDSRDWNDFDWNEYRKRYAEDCDEVNAAHQLVASVAELSLERNAWRDRAIAAEGQVRMMGLKARREQSPKAVLDAVTDYMKSDTGTHGGSSWRQTQKYWLMRFAKAVGPKQNIHDIEADDVIGHCKSHDITPKIQKDMAAVIRKFLTWATREAFDKRPLNAWLKTLQASPKEWFWLARKESERLVNAIRKERGDYWADAALIQWACGFRPEELPLLRSRNVEKNCKWIHLDCIKDNKGQIVRRLKTARSRDSINVPAFAQSAVRRQLGRKTFLLFPYSAAMLKRCVKLPTPFERDNDLWPGADAHNFSTAYLERLRSAAIAAKLDSTKVDSRTFRRTCGKDLLMAGKSIEQVAAVLRDNPETVRKHYARLLAADVSTER